MIRYDSNEDYSGELAVNVNFQGLTIGAENAATGADVDAPTTVTFPAGQQETSFSVTAIDDDSPEGNEWFQMSIASGGYEVGSDSRMTAIIESDVPTVWLTSTATGDDAPKEGDGQKLKFTAHRDNTQGPLKIWYYANSFDLVEGQDYDFPAGTIDADRPWLHSLEFADGQGTKDIEFTVIDDPDVERTESLTVTIDTAPSDLLAGDGKYFTFGGGPQPNFAEGEIQDNDVYLTLDAPFITVGYVRQATITATNFDGEPVSGKAISIDVNDSEDPQNPHIVPVDTTVTTGGDGTATVNLQGIYEGQCDIVMTPNGGLAMAAPAQAKMPRVRTTDMWVVVGGSLAQFVYLEENKVANFWTGIPNVALQIAPDQVAGQNIVQVTALNPAKTAEDGHEGVNYRGLIKGQTKVTFTDPNSNASTQINLTVEDPTIVVTVPPLVAGGNAQLIVRVTNSKNEKMAGVLLVLTDDAAVFTLLAKDGNTGGGDDPRFSTQMTGKNAGTANLKVKAVDSGVEQSFAVTVTN